MIGYGIRKENWGNFPAVRCECCNRLLFRGLVEIVEIKCPKCGVVHLLKNREQEGFPSYGLHRKSGRQTGLLRGSSVQIVTDSVGRLVSIPGRPQRVIALNASNLELYYATGGKVIGRALTEMLSPGIRDMVKNIPTVGIPPNPNTELIIAMNPDLVLGMNAPRHHELAVVLEKAGIPILLQDLTHYIDVLEALRFYGELSGKPEQAKEKIMQIEAQYRNLAEQSSRKQSPKVLILWRTGDGLYTAFSNSFIGDLVKRLGGVNVSDPFAPASGNLSYAPFSLEAALRAQPDVVLLISHCFGQEAQDRLRCELLGQPAWQGFNAIRKRHVYQLPYHLFAVNPGPQIGEALTVLSDFLYEDHAS